MCLGTEQRALAGRIVPHIPPCGVPAKLQLPSSELLDGNRGMVIFCRGIRTFVNNT